MGALEGFVVCLQRKRGLGEERSKLLEELLASAASFPRRIVVSSWHGEGDGAKTLETALHQLFLPFEKCWNAAVCTPQHYLICGSREPCGQVRLLRIVVNMKKQKLMEVTSQA